MTQKQYRIKEIKIRLTEQEHQLLQSKKTGLELATWIRATCLGVQTRQKNTKGSDPALVRQLAKIGANLNQLAKIANTEQAKGDIINLLRLTGELAIIREQLNELLKRHDS